MRCADANDNLCHKLFAPYGVPAHQQELRVLMKLVYKQSSPSVKQAAARKPWS
jgi:hypothetical protein